MLEFWACACEEMNVSDFKIIEVGSAFEVEITQSDSTPFLRQTGLYSGSPNFRN